MNRYLELFRELWQAPAGKQVVFILALLPVGIITFFQIYYKNTREDNNYLRTVNKDQQTEIINLSTVLVKEVKECDRKVHLVDSIHRAKAEEKQLREDARNYELIRELRQDLKAAERKTEEAKEINKSTLQKIISKSP